MSKPNQRKSKPVRRPATVDYMAPAVTVTSRADEPAPNALAAESTNGLLGFTFRGHRFVIDYATADFGKAMFAVKLAGRPGASVAASFEKMLDCLEAVLGEEQLTALYDVAPDVFSSEATQREFWGAFAEMTVGAGLPESSAS